VGFAPTDTQRLAACVSRLRTAASWVLMCLFMGAFAPQQATARWMSVARGRSSTSPYFVCPQTGRGARCQVIEDPTRGSPRRGPLAMGAITAGPEQEVSPALSGTGERGGYSPADLRSAYDLPSSAAGSGETVGVVDAHDDPDAEADMNAYRTEYGISECTASSGCFSKVNQEGEKSSYPTPEAKWVTEISLDLDMVSAVCPQCHIVLVEADTAEAENMAAAEDEAASLRPAAISDSFTEPEEPAFASAYDHPGIPIAAASGDNGYGVSSPASYPGVIAVGGTTLQHNASGRPPWTETVWSGTGSGCTREPKPAWQDDGGCDFRTDNDVAAVADINTPVSVYDSYETKQKEEAWLLLGGTSAATPIVAGAMALASPYTRSFPGAQALYLDAAAGGGFNEITSGANGGCGSYLCQAGPGFNGAFGFNGPTGLGGLRGAPEVPPPTAVTGAASHATESTAIVAGTVNTHGAPAGECSFEYGPTAAYGASVPCEAPPAPSTGASPVSATLTRLSAGTEYHYRVLAGYLGGPADGTDRTFTTTGVVPSVQTAAATAVTASSAVLNGTVNPGGETVDECWFEYGTSLAYGKTVRCSTEPGAGEQPVDVSAAVTGLIANTTYHFRVLAKNANATGDGADRTVTLPEGPSPAPEGPTVVTEAPTAVTDGSATLNALVNPNGGAVSVCEFEFDGSRSPVPCATAPADGDEAPQAVSASVSGLRADAAFQYRIVAVSATGSSYGAVEEFLTLPAPEAESTTLLTPPPLTPPFTSPPVHPVAAAEVELAGKVLTVGPNGTLSVKLRCASAGAYCRGTITLRTVAATNAAARRVLTLASGSFAPPKGGSGATVTVKLRLSGRARSLLARLRTLRASAMLVIPAPGGDPRASQTIVTLRMPASATHAAGTTSGAG
jgi:hypothetical protein